MSILPDSPTWSNRARLQKQPVELRHIMYQSWNNLLFLHWEFEPEIIQRTLPAGLNVDTFDGKAYLGIVPFYMNWIRPRYLPAFPWISFFLETNLRTYVYDNYGNSGVWFYSLDCNQPIAVWTARTFFKLPYEHAAMNACINGQRVDYSLTRRGQAEEARFIYEPAGDPFEAKEETLEFFLAERYLLYANTKNGLATGRVHHSPYPLQYGSVAQWDNTLISLAGFDSPARPPDNILMSTGVDVRVYPLHPLD